MPVALDLCAVALIALSLGLMVVAYSPIVTMFH